VALPRDGESAHPAAVARALLDAVIAYYAEHADPEDLTAPVPLPERRFLAGGEPRVVAWDTDAGQVHTAYERTIGARNPTAAQAPGRLPRSSGSQRPGTLARSLALEVQIVRPAPGLGQLRTLPTEQQLDRHGVAIGNDLYHLERAVRLAAQRGDLHREQVRESDVIIGDCLSLGPSGALAAVALGITVPLL
jgi:hypothetical protein